MRIGSIETSGRVAVVAEIGNNHEGDVALAEELIRLAADAGADAVKFQTFDTAHYVTIQDERRFAQLRRFELPRTAYLRLKSVADAAGVVLLSTPFDLGSVTFLDPFVPAFKIASGDITFFPLLEAVARTGKPLVLSTGAATIDEVQAAVACVRRVWRTFGITGSIALLHCVASYPVPPAQANLMAIATLRERFPDCTIGYSDHAMGIEAAVAAVALGARIVEKHFTIAHNHSDFRDHQLSATPDELRVLVGRIRMVEEMRGNGEKVPQVCEEGARVGSRRSIAAAHALPKGVVLVREHLTWVRPAGGIPPGEEIAVVGQRLREAVAAGVVIAPALVERVVEVREAA